MNPILLYVLTHIKMFLTGIGVTGAGVGFIKLMKHWPAPVTRNKKLGAIFDTVQDLISNNERIGQRSDTDSAFVSTKKESGAETSTTLNTDPNEGSQQQQQQQENKRD
jgi:hypothetical protein